MESGMSLMRQGSMPRLRGGQWASEHCVQKVEEMLSRAIVHQEDLLGLLTSNSPESNTSLDSAAAHNGTISPPVLRALKAKIENSMDWCHLALCRLREIVLHSSTSVPLNSSPSTENNSTRPSSGGAAGLLGSLSGSYSKSVDAAKLEYHNPSPKLNVPSPLSPLRLLLRKEPLSPHPFTVQGCESTAWNPGNSIFNDSAPQLPPGVDSSSQQQQQGQNFNARLPAMDSDWPLLTEAVLQAPPLAFADPYQCSSTCQINPPVDQVTDHFNIHTVAEDHRSFINRAPTRGNRSRNSSAAKSEVRKLSGVEAKLEVVFQKLNDAKKGIPEDSHRGWKKYGNKSIQNSNHCRGYYKCSAKECRAKKMVQPTDKDPTLFEVTYVGKHTCSNTGQPRGRNRSNRASAGNPMHVGKKGSSEEAKSTEEGKSTVTKDDEAQDWKKRAAAGIGIDSVEDGSNISATENGWKRGRSNDFSSFLNNMTTSTTSEEAEDGDGDASMDTYLHQSSQHHQAVFSFQEPLLWHDFDMDTSLSAASALQPHSSDR